MIRPLAIALVAAILYTGLGLAVSQVPPFGIDVLARPLAGHAMRLALVFTESCWWYVLLALGIAAIVLAVRVPAWRTRVWFAIPTTLVTWQVSDLLKNIFHRPRPPYWHLIRESSYSYSSGHAMFALLVYGLWAWYVWRSDLPRSVRRVVAPLLALWGCGIVWSRLALGAHYVTDLIGGLLLAVTALAVANAVAAASRASKPTGSAQGGRVP
ncbi:MAG TPA: phosphatase PAP2 family protein [Candidatus Limnocylindria bacterium]|nr:phosphatase PAP2 family protein [Candidatus Limnocylindria bacterium]